MLPLTQQHYTMATSHIPFYHEQRIIGSITLGEFMILPRGIGGRNFYQLVSMTRKQLLTALDFGVGTYKGYSKEKLVCMAMFPRCCADEWESAAWELVKNLYFPE